MSMMVVIIINVGITAFRPYDKTIEQNYKNQESMKFFRIAEVIKNFLLGFAL